MHVSCILHFNSSGNIILQSHFADTPVYDTAVKGAVDHDSIQLQENPAYDSVYWEPKTSARV